MCDNLPCNFSISDITMVVYNLSLSIRSTLFNYKPFAFHLTIDEFLKDPTSIKYCCNKYDNSFVNNHYGHIITGNLNIVNNERLRQLMLKGRKYQEPKQICFDEAREKIQTSIDQFIERISNEKSIHKNHFSDWKLNRSGAFWSRSKSKTGRSYSLQELKSCLKFVIKYSFFPGRS